MTAAVELVRLRFLAQAARPHHESIRTEITCDIRIAKLDIVEGSGTECRLAEQGIRGESGP
jgi:hypothetical protein